MHRQGILKWKIPRLKILKFMPVPDGDLEGRAVFANGWSAPLLCQ
jgi:hypothetical protein